MNKADASSEPSTEFSEAPDLFAGIHAFAEMWRRGSQTFFEGQQKWVSGLAKATLGYGEGHVPESSTLKAAQEAYSAALSEAMNLSSKLSKTFEGGQGDVAEAQRRVLLRLFEPQAWWASAPYAEGVARMQEGPHLADVGQTERMFAAAYSAMVMVRQRSIEHQMVMTNAWTRAANKFMSQFGTESDAAKALTGSWGDLTSTWIQIANDELIATQRTEEYLSSQRNLLNASTDLRLANQNLAAFYGEMFGIPTRAEIDDVHRTLTELRRELRAFQRSMTESGAAHV